MRRVNYLRYVKVVGTMHVSPESRERVVEEIRSWRPHAVALELDWSRFMGIQSGHRPGAGEAFRLGRSGALNYFLAKVEERLGEQFGMAPGEEMRAAAETAASMGAQIFLIDEDIRVILSKLLAAPLREKLMLALESLSVFLPFALSSEDFNPIEDYRIMMAEFRERYPYIYRVLVEERNLLMALRIASIVEGFMGRGIRKPRIVAVVGLGHKPGLEHLLNGAISKVYNPLGGR